MQEKVKKLSPRKTGLPATTLLFQICIALMPTLHLLNTPFLNVSLGTVVLLVFLPYSVLHIWNWYKSECHDRKRHLRFLPFIVFYLYLFLRAGRNIAYMVLSVATLIHICGMLCGSVQAKVIRKVLVGYAVVNTLLVLIQTVCYYGFDWHIQYIPKGLIHAEFQESYVFRELSGLYRPSALFLEPSHFSQYCCFAIISLLFPSNGKPNLLKALMIAAGCVLTTSGMGIALTAGIFLWFFIAYFLLSGRIKRFSVRQILIGAALTVICLVIVCQIPLVKAALQRVVGTVDGYNAIAGRLGLWKWEGAIGTMKPLNLLFGYNSNAEYTYYLAGLADTIYKFGLVGTVLELICFGYLMFKKRTHYVWCTCLSFLVLFVMAHLTTFFVHMFYFGLVIAELCTDDTDYSHKTELKNDEIKKIGLEILSDVADFCDKNSIRYYLACGTALGAIRHNGFIPWDDDVDIAMPRTDYERFIALYRSDRYSLRDARFDKKYPYAFAKVCDDRTILIENIENPCDLGVYIDIFPIDGLPKNGAACARHMKRIDWDLRILAWKRIGKDKKVGLLHKAIQIIAKTVLLPVPVWTLVKKLDRDVRMYDYESAEHVGLLVGRAFCGSDIKEKELFGEPIKHRFEDREFWVPGQVDKYLASEYGDYMQLPPKEKQIAKHDFVAYYK